MLENSHPLHLGDSGRVTLPRWGPTESEIGLWMKKVVCFVFPFEVCSIRLTSEFYFCYFYFRIVDFKLSFDYFKNWQVEVKLAAFIFKTSAADAITEQLMFLGYANTLQVLDQWVKNSSLLRWCCLHRTSCLFLIVLWVECGLPAFLRFLIFSLGICMSMSACVNLCAPCVCSASGGQTKALELLALKWQVVLTNITWILGI